MKKWFGGGDKTDKNLIQKFRGGFQNGPWNGHFIGEGGAKRYFQLHLHFHKNGVVDGTGTDATGKLKVKDGTFTMSEAPNTFRARLKWENKWEALIEGNLDPSTAGVSGGFSMNHSGGSHHGKFHMTPSIQAMGDSGVNLAAQLQQPAAATPGGLDGSLGGGATGGGLTRDSGSPAHSPSSQNNNNDAAQIQTLREMGFPQHLCEQAVQQAGTLESQVEWIATHPDGLTDPVATNYHNHQQQQQQPPPPSDPKNQEAVEQLVSMGFPQSTVQTALLLHNGNVTAATEWLVTTGSDPDKVAAAEGALAMTNNAAHARRDNRDRPSGRHKSHHHHHRHQQQTDSQHNHTQLPELPAGMCMPTEENAKTVLEFTGTEDLNMAMNALAWNQDNVELAVNWILENASNSPPLVDLVSLTKAGGGQVQPNNNNGPTSFAPQDDEQEDHLALNRGKKKTLQAPATTGKPEQQDNNPSGGGGRSELDDLFDFASPAPTPQKSVTNPTPTQNSDTNGSALDDLFSSPVPPASTTATTNHTPFNNATPDPFKQQASPFNNNSNDPFSQLATTSPPKTQDPFATGPTTDPFAQSNTSSNSDPFAAVPPTSDPFNNSTTNRPSGDPFAAVPPTTDPFAQSNTNASDPFSQPTNNATTTNRPSTDPFAAVAPTTDPFSSSNQQAPQQSDPFATSNAAADPFDAFGSSQPPASTEAQAPPKRSAPPPPKRAAPPPPPGGAGGSLATSNMPSDPAPMAGSTLDDPFSAAGNDLFGGAAAADPFGQLAPTTSPPPAPGNAPTVVANGDPLDNLFA
eukprot:TRINITY_DN66931_c6_g1_i1.p1 TRINITY_DN66931_c6_g1~~TRINITY_DN66931_c6_g1_i1.p1  ORF type:complete len:809 (+),score=169.66 TRINITY_DN66931_c6_g1_i1:32-2428(+)